jgi:hypothetical protein
VNFITLNYFATNYSVFCPPDTVIPFALSAEERRGRNTNSASRTHHSFSTLAPMHHVRDHGEHTNETDVDLAARHGHIARPSVLRSHGRRRGDLGLVGQKDTRVEFLASFGPPS